LVVESTENFEMAAKRGKEGRQWQARENVKPVESVEKYASSA